MSPERSLDSKVVDNDQMHKYKSDEYWSLEEGVPEKRGSGK